ncbi:hypothetical protein J4423_03225 [Candidatus Pacearchaeota archaeon]|nr:hypothetical protein [Candidatus Pacearchaeota archaeon]
MEKDIDRIPKNQDTDIVIRVDDFGGKAGLTIREFVRSERYTGFTKAGTRISAEHFKSFKEAINSIKEEDFMVSAEALEAAKKYQESKSEKQAQTPQSQPKQHAQTTQEQTQKKEEKTQASKKKAKAENYEELEM